MEFDEDESRRVIQSCIGQEVESFALTQVRDVDVLSLVMKDGRTLQIRDSAAHCCEQRYMNTDDDLPYYAGATLLAISIGTAHYGPPIEYGDHEVQFLHVKTSKGSFTVQTHNEHNGYYGGFEMRAKIA